MLLKTVTCGKIFLMFTGGDFFNAKKEAQEKSKPFHYFYDGSC